MTRQIRPVALQLDYQVAAARREDAPSKSQVARWAELALQGEREQAELAVRVVDKEEARALNLQYRGKDYATNVLSFPAELPEFIGLPLLGDIVICAPVVEAEAVEQGKAAQAHWAHMIVHGVLHLLGYDHEQQQQAELMEERERGILAQLGFNDPYKQAGG
jgi:probable rRNA maturation factor